MILLDTVFSPQLVLCFILIIMNLGYLKGASYSPYMYLLEC